MSSRHDLTLLDGVRWQGAAVPGERGHALLAALTLAAWRGWSASLRMRAINHYRLDGEDPSIVAAGHTILDFGMSRRIRRGVEFNLAVDNLTNRDYYETQNYFDSRVAPAAPVLYRIHATPGYPLNAVAGLTFRFGGK